MSLVFSRGELNRGFTKEQALHATRYLQSMYFASVFMAANLALWPHEVRALVCASNPQLGSPRDEQAPYTQRYRND